MKRETWFILGLNGLADDIGCCVPFTVGEVIQRRLANGENLTKEDIESIARNFGCRAEWKIIFD